MAVEAIAAKDQEIAQCEENKMAKQQELHKTKEVSGRPGWCTYSYIVGRSREDIYCRPHGYLSVCAMCHVSCLQDVSALDKYSMSIRPNCDFILSNYDTRKQQRQAEKTALEDVSTHTHKSDACRDCFCLGVCAFPSKVLTILAQVG